MTTIAVRATKMRTLGLITVVASVIGAACAVVILAWPPQVGDQWYSYPFDSTGYTVSQSFFAIHHLGILAGLYGLWLLARSRVARAGVIIAMVGMVALTACELFAITAAEAQVGTPAADAVDNAYGVPTILIGIGLILAGFNLTEARWITVALGIYVFVPLIPAIFGPLVLGRIAIGVWMLLFAALGLTLMRTEP